MEPADLFRRNGGQVEAGYYVIRHQGHAVTVHCENVSQKGAISLQFMCGPLRSEVVSRKAVERLLLARVVPDPQAQAEISGLLQQLSEAFDARRRNEGRAAA